MQHKLLAVVARATNYRDHDRILTLITRERGRLTATARGCRKPQSKLLSCTQPFCYGEYELQERDGRFYVRGCDIHEIFYDLRLDPKALSAAAFVTSVCEQFANPEEENARHFALLLRTLSYLCRKDADIQGILSFFLIKLLDFSGYRPQVDACVLCGETQGLTHYDAQLGGALCALCARQAPRAKRVKPSTLEAMDALVEVPSAAYPAIAEQLEAIGAELLPLCRQTIGQYCERKLPELL